MDLFTLESTEENRPLYERLYRYIANEIISGHLKPGEKIPSKRALADHLQVSQNTVESAYTILTAEGYLESRPKSGFYVGEIDALSIPTVEAEPKSARPTTKQFRYDFTTNAVDLKSFPYVTWAKLNREVLYQNPELVTLGDGQGDLELRESLAKYLHEFRGVRCDADQIIIGAGIEYLLMLLCKLFDKDDIFAIENPGYKKTETILRNSGRTVCYIPLDKNGISMDELKKTDAQIAYITPSHQFPTGVIMPVGRRTELLKWANEQDGRYLIEDDYNSEFHFSGKPIPSIQGLDKTQKVIYLSTFSRTIAPSIRIAYMVLPLPLLSQFEKQFSSYSSTVSRFEQQTLARFIAGGYLTRHRNRVKNIYKKRQEELKNYLNSREISFSGGGAGLHLLLDFSQLTKEVLVERANRVGFRLYFLSDYYFPPRDDGTTLIIGYGEAQAEEIEEALNLLF